MTNENEKPRFRIEIPTMRRGIDNREAYRKFVEEGDKTTGAEPQTSQPVTFSNKSIVAHDYVQIPQSKKLISKFEVQGYNNMNWQDTHFKLNENGFYMPTVPLFMEHFVNVVEAYKGKGKKPLFDANGNPISKEEIKDIYLHLTKNHIAAYGQGTSLGAWTWLDAKFDEQNGSMNVSSEHRTFIDGNGNKTLQAGKIENLEKCLMTNSFSDLVFNKQGLSTQTSATQQYTQGENIYFWYPRDKAVARFGAGSGGAALDCASYPGGVDSSLGVFAVLDGEARGQKQGGAK